MFQNAKEQKKSKRVESENKTEMKSSSTSQGLLPFTTLHLTSSQICSTGTKGVTRPMEPIGPMEPRSEIKNRSYYTQNYLRYCPENVDDQGQLIEGDHSCSRCSIHNFLNSQSNLNKEAWEWKKNYNVLEQTSRYEIAMVVLESWCLPELLFAGISRDMRLLLLYPT